MADIESYDLFLPWCLSSRVVETTVGKEGHETLKANIQVGFQMMRELARLTSARTPAKACIPMGILPFPHDSESTFTSKVTLIPKERVLAVSHENEYLEDLTFSWDFAPIGTTACRLDLQLGAPPVNYVLCSATCPPMVIDPGSNKCCCHRQIFASDQRNMASYGIWFKRR